MVAPDGVVVAPGSPATPRRVVRGTLTFGLASVLQRAAPILLLPLFSRVLTPSEFGQIGVIVTLASALGTVVGLGLETAIFRGYLKAAGNPGDARAFVNTVGGFALIAPFVLAAVAAASTAPWLSSVFGVPVVALVLAYLGAAATVSATLVPLALLRAQERLRSYFQLAWAQIALTSGLTVVCVAVLGWGVIGWMVASTLSAIVLLIRGLSILGHRWTFQIDVGALRAALRFGIPLVPHTAAHWGLATSDRAILGALVPSSVVGAYYVAFLLTLPVNLVSVALSQATQPLFVEAASSAQRRTELGRVVTLQAIAVVLVSAMVALLGPPATRILLPPEFGDASQYIPWLAAGSCLFGLYLIPMNAVSVMAGRTRHVWVITIVAAMTNVALNVALVPSFGAMAAAVDTTIGYAILFAGVVLYVRRLGGPRIPYEFGRIALGTSLVAATAAIGSFIAPPDPALAFAVRALLLIGSGVLLVTVGPLRREARSTFNALRPPGVGAHRGPTA
jgi:O-antigen/teichoic acid export membrane protein